MNLTFFLHATPAKQDKQGLFPIKAQLDVNGARVQFTLPKLRALPVDWCNTLHRVLPSAQNSGLINTLLDRVQDRFVQARLESEKGKNLLTAKELQKILLMQETPRLGLVEMVGKFLEHYEILASVGKYSQNTWQYYSAKAKYWLAYFEKEGIHEPRQITRAMQNGLYLFVLANKSKASVRNPHNNAVQTLRTFKTFLEFAIDREWVEKNAFFKIRYQLQDCENTFLEASELEAVRSWVGKNKDLQETKDIFLLSCATGLAWSDLREINKEQLQNNFERLSLRIKRKKTKVEGFIPLFKEAREILEKYDFALPVPVYYTYKRRVQTLCKLVGISKTVGTHTGRKTFANSMLNDLGVPLETVSKMMLHTNLHTTARYYAKVSEAKVQRDTAHIE